MNATMKMTTGEILRSFLLREVLDALRPLGTVSVALVKESILRELEAYWSNCPHSVESMANEVVLALICEGIDVAGLADDGADTADIVCEMDTADLV
jgi:hypothetical protein